MKIVTWNVNSVRARLDRLHAWLDRVGPDVMCLQELKCQPDQLPLEGIHARGYQVAAHSQKTYNGVAILSRLPMTEVEAGLPLADDPQARGIAATIAGIRVACLYVPNGQSLESPAYPYKLQWLDALHQWLQSGVQPGAPVVLCGDFNIAPEDRDLYDPEGWRDQVLCSAPERDRLRALLDWGLTDALRHFDDSAGLYTWWDYRNLGFQKRQGLRIDHFLVSPPVLAAARAVTIDKDERRGKGASDHAPVILELDWAGA